MSQSAKQQPRNDEWPGPDAGILVTGSSGFIGTHLCRAMLDTQPGLCVTGLDLVAPTGPVKPHRFVQADISVLDSSAPLNDLHHPVVVHLAAKAEVVFPFDQLTDLVATNITGTLQVLKAATPKRMIFASSSAVYGDAGDTAVATDRNNVKPIGSYGMSKATAECLCHQWAKETGGAVVSLRFGNVIGPGCRGFIPYLVAHALQHPDGAVAAEARGRGKIVRDYVPVGYVAEVIQRAIAVDWEPASGVALNVGTGRAMTNGDVAGVVQEMLAERGIQLNIDWGNPIADGEAQAVVLNMDETVGALGLPVPTHGQVVEVIRDAVCHCLDAAGRGE